MNYTDEIIKIANRQKMFHTRMLTDLDIPTVYLTRMVKDGRLRRIGRGLYMLPGAEFDEKQSMLEASQQIAGCVVCLLSALRFHDLTTQNPFQIWLAIDRNSAIPRIRSAPIRIIRFSDLSFTEGVESHDLDGITIMVYNVAKTIADCFKYRNKIGTDLALEALRDAWRQKKVTMDDLWHYARVCRVANVMRPYLESLV